MHKKIILTVMGILICSSALANTIDVNVHEKITSNRIMRGIPINNINDVKNIDGPFYMAEVTVFPDRYSNPNLPSDPVVMDCHGKIIKIYPGHVARCADMEEGKRATVRIDAVDFKLGADIQILIAK